MLISHKHKFVFTAIPKTGTRSVYTVLKKHYDGEVYKDHHTIIPDEFKNYYSFTVIRNPYDRIVSMWWATCKRELSTEKTYLGDDFRVLAGSDKLEDLLSYMLKTDRKNNLLSKQNDYLKHNRFDCLLRNEKLNEQFKDLPFITGDEDLPRVNSTTIIGGRTVLTRDPDPFVHINSKSLKLINEYYAEDFNVLPYEKVTKL